MKRLFTIMLGFCILLSQPVFGQYTDRSRTDGKALANTLGQGAREGDRTIFGDRIQRGDQGPLGKPDTSERTEYFLERNSPTYVKMRLQELEKQLYEKTKKQVESERRAKLEFTPRATDKFYNEADELRNQHIESLASADIEREVQRRMDSEVVLKHFGKDFFEAGKMDKASLFEGVAPSDYKLGPGDEIKVIVWSELGDQTVYDMQINPEGQIYIPILGVIQVSGLTVKKLEENVVGKLSAKFKHFKGQATLSKVKTIQVFVTGEVEQPGAMVVSGLSTAFATLYQAGGPTRKGTMRDISVISSKGTYKKIDLYDYFLTGNRNQDIPIANGDTIFVPIAGSRATASGMVARPAIYEITANTSLSQLIEMAGGVLPSAYSARVSVIRWDGAENRRAFDVSLNNKQELNRFIVKDGDEIKIEQAIENVGNAVTISGPVNKPGKYAIDGHLTLQTLIERAGGLIREEANMLRGQIYRKLEGNKQQILSFNLKFAMAGDANHNHGLKPFDVVRLFSEEEVKADVLRISIDGAIRRPGQYIYRSDMRLADLLVKARGLTLDADGTVEIARVGENNVVSILRLNAKNALENANSVDNAVLMPLDRVTLPSNMLKKVETDVVVLKGQVVRPGPYALKHRGEKLSSLIERAGGLTPMAFAEGCVFTRLAEHVTSEHQLEVAQTIQGDLYKQATLELRTNLLRHGAKLDGEFKSSLGTESVKSQIFEGTKSVGAGELPQDLTKPQSSIFSEMEMRGRELGNRMIRIPVALKDILENTVDEYEDIALLNGDIIDIPVVPHTVSVIGAVMNPSTILYNSRQTKAGYYINKTGGFTKTSDHRRAMVIRANGEVNTMKNVRRIERGDIILIPPKAHFIKPNNIKEMADIASILGNLAISYKVIRDK